MDRFEIAIGTGGWTEGPFYKFDHTITQESGKWEEGNEIVSIEVLIPEEYILKPLHFKVLQLSLL